jgi:hypothetical protein
MAQTKNKKKRKNRSSDQVRRSAPKHSMKDLLKAVLISGASMAVIAGLFFVEIGSKSVVEHAADLVTGEESEASTDTPQMDRYTESETEGLDKLIKDKSK